MSESKADRLDSFLRKRVREALAEMALNSPDNARFINANASWMEFTVASKITSDPYRMRELLDICAWKKPPRGE